MIGKNSVAAESASSSHLERSVVVKPSLTRRSDGYFKTFPVVPGHDVKAPVRPDTTDKVAIPCIFHAWLLQAWHEGRSACQVFCTGLNH